MKSKHGSPVDDRPSPANSTTLHLCYIADTFWLYGDQKELNHCVKYHYLQTIPIHCTVVMFKVIVRLQLFLLLGCFEN